MRIPLTDDEVITFGSLVENRGNLQLIRTKLKGTGEPVAVIVDREEGGHQDMYPVAVLVNEHVMALLEPPPCENCGTPGHTHD